MQITLDEFISIDMQDNCKTFALKTATHFRTETATHIGVCSVQVENYDIITVELCVVCQTQHKTNLIHQYSIQAPVLTK